MIALSIIGSGVGSLYASTVLYDVPPAAPFEGDQWYNPYDVRDDRSTRWLKANFHAHSHAWRGLTEGDQSADDVVSAYRRMGYDVIALSNYHTLPPASDTSVFPVYEHGWNISKSHRLLIGAQSVRWRDYPVGQHMLHQQELIEQLRADGAVVAIAHPAMRNGHALASFESLSGYDALEVLNHFLPPAESQWDRALSSGRAVWLLANDDTHDIRGIGETGVHWTLVRAPSAGVADITSAIRAGRTIGVRGHSGHTELEFLSLRMRGDTMELDVRGPIDSVRLVGQAGAVRFAADADTLETRGDTIRVRAVADPRDGYLRAVIIGREPSARAGAPQALYLNPVVRYDGRTLGVSGAVISVQRTAAFRLSVIGLLTAIVAPHVARLGNARARRRQVPVAS